MPDGEVIDQKDVGEDDYVFSAITPKRFSNATVRMDPFEATRNALESLLTNIRVQRSESPYVKARSGMLDTEEHTEEKRDLSGLQVVSGGLQRYAQTVAENKWANTYEAFSNVMDNLKNQLETGGNTLLLAYSRDNFSSRKGI